MSYVLTILALLMAAVTSQPAGGPGASSRSFSGDAQLDGDAPFPVHLELAESGDRVLGTVTTTDAEFRMSGERSGDLVRGTLTAGETAVGTASLRLTAERVEGSFVLGERSGRLDLRATTRGARAYLHPEQNLALTPAQWREDFDALVAFLTTRHGNPYEHIARAEFERRIAEARRQLASRDAIGTVLLFHKLVALIGDGHTSIAWPRGRPRYPIETFWFEDGLRVIAVPPEQRSLLGARLVSVGGQPVTRIAERLRAYIGQHETEGAYRSSFPWLLQRAELLRDIGIGSAARTDFVVAHDDGRRERVSLQAGPPRSDLARYGRGAALWQRVPNDGFRHERWPDGTVYLNWRDYADLGPKSAALLADLDRSHPRRLIVDLRGNGGGDFNSGRAFIDQVRQRRWLDRRGSLYVLIGRQTFSAAMTNSVDFKRLTDAILVGEPAGAVPNGWQEVRAFHLPNSGLRVSVSTRKYEFLTGYERVDPDIFVAPRLSDWAGDRDAAVDAILRRPAPAAAAR